MKQTIHVVSLIALLLLCKPLQAEEADVPADDFWSRFGSELGWSWGGYASAGVELPRNESAEAAINEISLLTTWNNGGRWSFFGELELEEPLIWNEHNGLNTKRSRVDLERLYLDYNFNENVNLRMGRFLTPNSRWNLLHASPLVWTSTRPLATYRLFPQATNGLMMFGSKPVGDLALDYMLFTELLEDQDEDGEELPFEHVHGGRIALSKGWNVGVSLLTFAEKNVVALGNDDVRYRMLGIDFVTEIKGVELSGEGFARLRPGGGDGGSGAYLQAAVPLDAVGLNRWFWLTRVETLQRPQEDSAERWLTGLTWRVKSTQLLKLEFTGGNGSQPEAPRGFIASFALFF